MAKRTSNFTKSVEGRISNHNKLIYDLVDPDRIYVSVFGDQPCEDDRLLPYGEEIMDQKTMDIDDSYLGQPDDYIGTKVVVPRQDSVPVLDKLSKERDIYKVLLLVKQIQNPYYIQVYMN